MKICFLTDDPTNIGGGPEHIRRVSGLLAQNHHYTVDVITPKTMDPDFNFQSFLQRVKFTFWVLKFLLTSDYDIYHSHTFSTDAFLPIVRLRGKRAGITIHGTGKNLIGGGILNKTGIPGFLAWLILDVWPYDFRFSASKLKNFVTVGNGVDILEFDNEKSKPDPKHLTVLCVSRRDPVKGINILEEAIKDIAQKYPQVRLGLVTDRPRTAKDYKTADLYVLPSLSEGLPIVLLEAMAAKLPIVATDTGDCREIIEKADCGVIVQPGSARELSSAIILMLQNKNRGKMGERGYDYVKENYTWEKVAAHYHSSYRRLGS